MFDPDRHTNPKHFPRNPEYKDLPGLQNQVPPESNKEKPRSIRPRVSDNTGEDNPYEDARPSERLAGKWRFLKVIRRWISRILRTRNEDSEGSIDHSFQY